MSHIADVDLRVDDLDALADACQARGWTLHRGATRYRWVGRWFDDSPVPRSLFATEEEYRRVKGMTKADRKAYMEALLGKCDHMIEVPGHECQVGVVNVGGHYCLAWDWASTLKDVMGATDAWGRDDLAKLTPFLHDYVDRALANVMAGITGAALVEKCELSDGSLYLEYQLP